MGNLLEVDEDGHFLEDIIYIGGAWEDTYSSDGTFEISNQAYEGAGEDYDNDGVTREGWVFNGGNRGTYSWDPESLVLTENNESYNSGDGWNDSIWTQESTWVFLEHRKTTAYLSEGKNTWTHWYRNYNEDGEFDWRGGSSYTINSKTIEYTSFSYDVDEDDWSEDLRYEYKRTCEIIDSFPEGVDFSEGNTLTFQAREIMRKRRDYDYDAGQMADWVEEEILYGTSFTWHHMGDYLIWASAYAARGFEIAKAPKR